MAPAGAGGCLPLRASLELAVCKGWDPWCAAWGGNPRWDLCWSVAVLAAEWDGVRCAGGQYELWISLFRWVFHAFFYPRRDFLVCGKGWVSWRSSTGCVESAEVSWSDAGSCLELK